MNKTTYRGGTDFDELYRAYNPTRSMQTLPPAITTSSAATASAVPAQKSAAPAADSSSTGGTPLIAIGGYFGRYVELELPDKAFHLTS
mmetsp:Transcript_31931/g.51130  ORF Transcript_31931/g.51130 Transcript_31931/m.51130 type:complete len:88 (-) Transcript_31931:883-1146(-)